MTTVRAAAVAGMFYPADPADLAAQVQAFLAGASAGDRRAPKALVVPHAGYVHSGSVAAAAYARIRASRGTIRRVVILGPCHRVPVRDLALSGAGAFETPLGRVPVDREACRRILALPQVRVLEAAHRDEHALEVQLPFLQATLDEFAIVPLVVGDASTEQVAEVIDLLWDGPETLVVISSDLSHYHDYETARRLDALTAEMIERLSAEEIGSSDACGYLPLAGLLRVARARDMEAETLVLRNSGDTGGIRDRVVGYGAWAFLEAGRGDAAAAGDGGAEDAVRAADASTRAGEAHRSELRSLLERHGATLLGIATASIEHGLEHGKPLAVEPGECADDLRRDGASFVTICIGGELRGCVGTAEACRPLATDVARNAFMAAFGDPRFPGLTGGEFLRIEVSLSVLGPPEPMTFADELDLLSQLRPGVDGLLIRDGDRRALFLPVMWESLPRPADFLARLKEKAGLAAGHWSDRFEAWRFVAEEIS